MNTQPQNAQTVKLTKREIAILLFLHKAHPHKVATSTILHDVFGYKFDPKTNIVAAALTRLRKKLEHVDELTLPESPRGTDRGYTIIVHSSIQPSIDSFIRNIPLKQELSQNV